MINWILRLFKLIPAKQRKPEDSNISEDIQEFLYLQNHK